MNVDRQKQFARDPEKFDREPEIGKLLPSIENSWGQPQPSKSFTDEEAPPLAEPDPNLSHILLTLHCSRHPDQASKKKNTKQRVLRRLSISE